MEMINAQEMAKKHPETFSVLTKEEISKAGEGDHIKISVGNERFWCIVIKKVGDNFKATIANDLVYTETHGLRYGDSVEINWYNIYQIMFKGQL